VFTFTHNLAPGAARAQLGGGERTAAPAWQGRNTRFIYWYIGGCSLFAKPSFPRTRSRRPPRLEFLPKFAAAPFSRLAVAAAPATQSGGRLVRGYIWYIIPGSAVLHTCVAYYGPARARTRASLGQFWTSWTVFWYGGAAKSAENVEISRFAPPYVHARTRPPDRGCRRACTVH
jgi:hypothetical protein